MCFESKVAFTTERIHAAAVYCSDGRFGEQFDEFLTAGLGLPRYDRMALPGGPACMAGHAKAQLAEQGVLDELLFLVEAHQLERVVLIQHEGCAFYASRLGVAAERMKALQLADLVRAAHFIEQQTSLARVEGFFASVRGGRVSFESVAVV